MFRVKMKAKPKQFNLQKGLPNVLLLGNGVLRSVAEMNGQNPKNWSESLLKLPENNLNKKEREQLDAIPYSLQATILAPRKDSIRKDKYIKEFQTLDVADDHLLKDIVSLGFDAILTTNYTYEIENCFHPNYSKLKEKRNYAYTIERNTAKKRVDAKYLLHTFNQFEGSPPIWHIHGELRRKSSIILSHDEYARLIAKLIEENELNRNKYVDFAETVQYKSWLDYFLMSNLYIVGFGMDFSEFDLWWLLNRRMRENAPVGTIKLFTLKEKDEAKKMALRAMGVNVFFFKDIDDYITLYKRIPNEIFKKEKER